MVFSVLNKDLNDWLWAACPLVDNTKMQGAAGICWKAGLQFQGVLTGRSSVLTKTGCDLAGASERY